MDTVWAVVYENRIRTRLGMLTGYSVVQYQEISCLSLPYLRHQLPYFNFSRGLGVAKKSRKIEGKKSLGALENEPYLFFGETIPLKVLNFELFQSPR